MNSRKNLQLSYFDAFFSSFMVGAGESFFAAYALSKGLGEVMSGLIVGLPMMFGAVLQTMTPALFKRIARPRRWVVAMTSLQGVALLVLMSTSTWVGAGPVAIFLTIGVYWGFSFSAASVWNYWMGFLVPVSERSVFFSRRLRVTQYGIIAGLLLAGAFLQHGESKLWGPRAYFIPFGLAFLARAVSIVLLAKQSPLQYERVREKFTLHIGDFFRQARDSFRSNPQTRSDLIFLFLFNSSIYISSSFVTPFLFAKLEFDYLSFMACQMALFLGKIFSLLLAQKWIQRFGVRSILFWGALGMSPLPALWVVVQHTSEAVLLQSASGFFWGLFEVGVSLVLFSELPHRDKIQLLTWNSFFQTLAILIGTLIGGKFLSQMGETISGYFVIFVLGAGLRTVLVLANRQKILAASSARRSLS